MRFSTAISILTLVATTTNTAQGAVASSTNIFGGRAATKSSSSLSLSSPSRILSNRGWLIATSMRGGSTGK